VRKRRNAPPSAAIRRSVPVRTFADWNDPPPGFVEADLVAHGGSSAKGSYVQTLTLTDIATGWTECAPVLVREQKLLTDGRACIDPKGYEAEKKSVLQRRLSHQRSRQDVCYAHRPTPSQSPQAGEALMHTVRAPEALESSPPGQPFPQIHDQLNRKVLTTTTALSGGSKWGLC
jgi:hypothetical protein